MRVASYHLIVWKCKQETHTLCVRKGLDWNPAAALSSDQGQACVSLLKTSVFLSVKWVDFTDKILSVFLSVKCLPDVTEVQPK